MAKKMKYYCYISRPKVNQLYDQITDVAVREQTVTRSKGADVSASAEAGGILGVFKGALHTAARADAVVQSVGSETLVQRLAKVIEHIEEQEKVLDLNKLCTEARGVPLDAFCFYYSGEFFAEGEISRGKRGNISIRAKALDRIDDEIVISKKSLVRPAQVENEFEERGPNNSRVVSDMCLLMSQAERYTLSIACSYKYFANMGGQSYGKSAEWVMSPHSGNYHFFNGDSTAWLDSLLFVAGVSGNTIMGTPLFLVHGLDPRLRI